MATFPAVLVAQTALPAQVEAKFTMLPKLSTFLVKVAGMLPVGPDLPLPAMVTKAPTLPVLASVFKGPTAARLPQVRSSVTPLEQSYTQPIEGVVGTVISRRGM